jgi:hypothetical protein
MASSWSGAGVTARDRCSAISAFRCANYSARRHSHSWHLQSGKQSTLAVDRGMGLRTYPVADHFDIYDGQHHEAVVADQLEFLRRHLLPDPVGQFTTMDFS